MFEEENNEVTMEVEGIDKDFPDVDLLHDVQTLNNNATRMEQREQNDNKELSGQKERKQKSRVDRFHNKVNTASEMFDMDRNKESSQESGTTQSMPSFEEGETRSEDEESDNLSVTSSAKIQVRTQEEIDKEEEEYRQAKESLINQAVDKSFEKLAQFMRDSGWAPPESTHVKRTQEIQETVPSEVTGNGKKRKMMTVNGKVKKGSINSNSETTIYDNAVAKLPHEVDAMQINNEVNPNWISTSSEEINTSDEMILMGEALQNNHNLVEIFPEHSSGSD